MAKRKVTLTTRNQKHGTIRRQADRFNAHQGVERFISHLLEIAQQSLSASDLEPIDAELLRKGQNDVAIYAHQLLRLIDDYGKLGRPGVAEFGFECLWHVIEGTFLIGSRRLNSTESSEKYFATQQSWQRAAQMRAARAAMQNLEQQALQDAIVLEQRNQDAKPSIKALTHRVNTRLETAGHKAVSERTIRRHLSKHTRDEKSGHT